MKEQSHKWMCRLFGGILNIFQAHATICSFTCSFVQTLIKEHLLGTTFKKLAGIDESTRGMNDNSDLIYPLKFRFGNVSKKPIKNQYLDLSKRSVFLKHHLFKKIQTTNDILFWFVACSSTKTTYHKGISLCITVSV